MGFLRSPRRLTIAEFEPDSGDLVAPATPEEQAEDALVQAKPFAPQMPAVALDPIFGTPLTDADPWRTAQPSAEEDDVLGPRTEVEVLGNGYQVNGMMATGQFGRLSDWLNMQQGWVNIFDGVLFRPGHEASATDRARTSQWVRLNQVVLVAERQTVQRDRANTPFVKKERRRVTITTQEFQLRGYVHIVSAGSMRTYLESADPHFLPMTDVVVRWLVDDAVVSHYPFALINRGQLISVSEEVGREANDEPAEPRPAEVRPAWLRTA